MRPARRTHALWMVLLPVAHCATAMAQAEDPAFALEVTEPLAVEGHSPPDKVLVSHNGRHVACFGNDRSAKFVVSHDERRYEPAGLFEKDSLIMSLDGASVAWTCRGPGGKGEQAFLNGEPVGESAQSIEYLSLSPDGSRWAALATFEPDRRCVVVDGKVIERLSKEVTPAGLAGRGRRRGSTVTEDRLVFHRSEGSNEPFVWSANSESLAFGLVGMVEVERVAVIVVPRDGDSFAIENPGCTPLDRTWGGNANRSAITFSRSGRRVAFARTRPVSDVQRRASGEKRDLEIVLASRDEQAVFAVSGTLRSQFFGPDGETLWYLTIKGKIGRVFANGDPVDDLGDVCISITDQPGAPFYGRGLFFDRLERPVTVESLGPKMIAVRVGHELHPELSQIDRSSLQLDPTGEHIVYAGRPYGTDGGWAWYLDGERTTDLNPSYVGGVGCFFSPDGTHTVSPCGAGTLVNDVLKPYRVQVVGSSGAPGHWFSPDSRYLYAYATDEAVKTVLLKLDLTTGERTMLRDRPVGFVADTVLFDPTTNRPLFFFHNAARGRTILEERVDEHGASHLVPVYNVDVTTLLQSGRPADSEDPYLGSGGLIGSRNFTQVNGVYAKTLDYLDYSRQESAWWDEGGLNILGIGRDGVVRRIRLSRLHDRIGSAPVSKYDDLEVQTLQDETVKVRELRGRVVYLFFWGRNNPTRGALPEVIELYKKYHDRGFEIIGFGTGLTGEQVLEDCKRHGMTWPQAADGSSYENYAGGTPGGVLLDRKGYELPDEGEFVHPGTLRAALKSAFDE